MNHNNRLEQLISTQKQIDSLQSHLLKNQAVMEKKYAIHIQTSIQSNIQSNLQTDCAEDSWFDQRFPNLKPLQTFAILSSKKRVNLVTDSINTGSLYGGVGTSIILCTLLAEKWDCSLRIITRTEKADENNFFNLLTANGISCGRNVNFTFASIYERKSHEVDVGESDIFITTSWWTTWSTLKSISAKKIFYILQEDERMFYPYGDEHLKCGQILANTEIQFIVNSKLLFEHFISAGFNNIKTKGLWFEPSFSRSLYYKGDNNTHFKKRFLFYARPNNLRNLFYLGLEVIEAAIYRGILDINEWDLFFVGKDIPQLKIAGFYQPKIIENLNWLEYAKFIRSVDLGLCLMYTPHPSYPPLDLAASGAVVISNRFGIKQELDTYSKNIICKDCNLESILQGLSQGIQVVKNQTLRSKHFEENNILRDWQLSFKNVIENLEVN